MSSFLFLMKCQRCFESWVIIPRNQSQGAEVLTSRNEELDSAGAEHCWMMLSGPRFCCLLFASVTVYRCPAKQLIWLCSCILYYLHFFISRGSNQWNCPHISASPPLYLLWYCHGFMLLYFCFGPNWYTPQVFPNTFRHSKWSFSVMLCKSPQWMNVCLVQCPVAVAMSSNKCLHVSGLINVSVTSLKTFRSSFPVFFLPSAFLYHIDNKRVLQHQDV